MSAVPPAEPTTDGAPGFPDLSGRTILQVIPELSAGGAERTVLEVAEALRAAGATALVASQGGRMEKDLEALGGELIRLNMASKNPITLRGNAARLSRLVNTRGIDLIHARSRAPAWSALWAARRTGVPFVTTYHGAYSARSRLKRLYNSVMARADRVIANSEWTAAHVRKEHGVEEARLVTIPRGVDMMAFDPAHVSPERIAAQRTAWELDTREGDFVLLLPGRLTEWKGQGLALEALAALAPDEIARLHLVFLGDPQGREAYVTALTHKAETLGLTERVRFQPHTRDMPAAYLAADIILAPSTRPEAFGRTAAEASAMTRPVIAADHGGARETIVEGQTGTRFTPGSATALAGAIRTLVSLRAEARAAMGLAGREYVRQHFSKRGLQLQTLGVYAELLGVAAARG
ncbi:MAG: glycosyltransferase family 4 protein [Hyphomonadaceae bacterium]|nr:glycosyltransferase family 4 protein [Hyphomonadaceae bacterium]